jgi:hypothetical protein
VKAGCQQRRIAWIYNCAFTAFVGGREALTLHSSNQLWISTASHSFHSCQMDDTKIGDGAALHSYCMHAPPQILQQRAEYTQFRYSMYPCNNALQLSLPCLQRRTLQLRLQPLQKTAIFSLTSLKHPAEGFTRKPKSQTKSRSATKYVQKT